MAEIVFSRQEGASLFAQQGELIAKPFNFHPAGTWSPKSSRLWVRPKRNLDSTSLAYYAQTFDGYAFASVIGFDMPSVGMEVYKKWQESGTLPESFLDIRCVLFCLQRALNFTSTGYRDAGGDFGLFALNQALCDAWDNERGFGADVPPRYGSQLRAAVASAQVAADLARDNFHKAKSHDTDMQADREIEALLRDGVPVLGVVLAYAAPDSGGDLFYWAEGMRAVHRNNESVKRDWPAGLTQESVAFVSQDADLAAKANAALLEPVRYRTVPGIAYRLALVAAGEGDLAISLNAPTGWDVAGGHALLIGAGGDLFDSAGARVTYDKTGIPKNNRLAKCFGGKSGLVSPYVHRSWGDVRVRGNSEVTPASSLSFLEPGKVIDDPNLLSRAQGCLLGQFAGDALGSLVEFNSASEISRKYPTGPSLLADGGTFSTIAGQPTDDSEMALALARSILAMGCYDRDDVAASYARWLESKPFDVGTTISAALSAAVRALKAKGNPGKAALAAASRSSQANGALMRVSPLAIHSYAKGAEKTMELARADAELTHPHGVCQDANAVFAAAVAFAVGSGETAVGVYEFALGLASTGKISGPVLDRLTAAREGAPPEFEGAKMGWVLVAFQNAFYHLLHSASPEEAIVETVRSGGDTDTNAAITGALLGAVYGRDRIPQQWQIQIQSCRPISGLPGVKRPRPAVYWPVDVLNVAENLLVAGRSYE